MVDLRGFGLRNASLPVTRPDRGRQEPAQLPCSRNFSQQQQPSNVQRSDLQQQQQPSDVQRGDLNPAAQPWQPAGSADTNTSESGAAASAAVNTEARRRKRGCRGNGALQRRKQQRTQEWRNLERNSRPAVRSMREQPGRPMRERPGPRVRPSGRAPLGKVWHTWDGWVDATMLAPSPDETEQRAGTRRSSSVEPLGGVGSVVEAIKTQTDAIAALAAAVEKMSRTVSNFVFAQRGSRKGSGSQGQSEVREQKEKKKAEQKKNAGATSVAAAESAGLDAEDAAGTNAEDMAELTEEREKAEWVCVGDVSSNSSRWQEDASETAAVIAAAVVRHRLQGQGERDDMLCGVMQDAVEEVPVVEAVSYAAAVAAVAVLAVTMMAVTAKVAEAEEAAAAAVKTAEAVEAKAKAAAVMAAQAVEAEAEAITQQKWEQRCAEHAELLSKQKRSLKREEWWVVCLAERDERVSRLEAICTTQAQATMEMSKMFKMFKAQ